MDIVEHDKDGNITITMKKEDYLEYQVKEWLDFTKGHIDPEFVRTTLREVMEITWDKLVQPLIEKGVIKVQLKK